MRSAPTRLQSTGSAKRCARPAPGTPSSHVEPVPITDSAQRRAACVAAVFVTATLGWSHGERRALCRDTLPTRGESPSTAQEQARGRTGLLAHIRESKTSVQGKEKSFTAARQFQEICQDTQARGHRGSLSLQSASGEVSRSCAVTHGSAPSVGAPRSPGTLPQTLEENSSLSAGLES